MLVIIAMLLFNSLQLGFFSIDELFEKVLERLEDDNKESGYEGNLVEQVLIIL